MPLEKEDRAESVLRTVSIFGYTERNFSFLIHIEKNIPGRRPGALRHENTTVYNIVTTFTSSVHRIIKRVNYL